MAACAAMTEMTEQLAVCASRDAFYQTKAFMTAMGGAALAANSRDAAAPMVSPFCTSTPLATNTERIPKLLAPAMSVATPSPIASTRSFATGLPRMSPPISSARS